MLRVEKNLMNQTPLFNEGGWAVMPEETSPR
jgi:hypothetical protein